MAICRRGSRRHSADSAGQTVAERDRGGGPLGAATSEETAPGRPGENSTPTVLLMVAVI